MAIEEKQIEEKIVKGEKLTPEEEKEIMSDPNESLDNVEKAPEAPTEEIAEEEFSEEGKVGGEAPAKETPKKEAAAKKEEPKKEPAKEEAAKEPDMGKIEADLELEDGKIDFKGYTKNEIALYWEMKKARRRAQKAEEERDVARLNLVREKEAKAAKDKEAAAKKEEEEDPLKGRDDTEFLTVKDVKALLAKKETPKEEPQKAEAPLVDINNPVTRAYLNMCDKMAEKEVGADYQEVMECTQDIINTNPEYVKEIYMAAVKGEVNPAVVAYNIIKADPEFAKILPIAQARLKAKGGAKASEKKEEPPKLSPEEQRKLDDAKRAQEAIDKNSAKKKTSGHAASQEGKLEGDLTLEDIASMSDKEFAKLPKKTRDEYLKRFGA